MITIGVDAHKRVHVAYAVDEAGHEIGQWRGANNASGWQHLFDWARQSLGERQWGIEGAWSYGRNLAQFLVNRGETVFDINPRWTAFGRRRGRRPSKSDSLDARAVALVVRQEAPGLPVVTADDDTVVLDLLTNQRDQALFDATRIRNQIHCLVMQIDPEYSIRLPTLKSKAGLAALHGYVAPDDSPLQVERAAAVRRLAQRLQLAVDQAEALAKRIKSLAGTRFEPLTRLCGVDLLTAGALAGILGPGRRFSTDAQLAAYAGAAPLEASSAGLVRHRLNRGGNRRLNAILYRIVLTQAHHLDEARAYLDRRVTEGKSRREAMRALKRFVIRAIWRNWQDCYSPAAQPVLAAVA
jgi:transposase